MKFEEALRIIADWDKQGIYLFSRTDLGKLFNEREPNLDATIKQLINKGFLERIARNLYLYSLSHSISPTTIEDIACRLRRGEYSYIGLESAASMWNIISQIPVGRLTIMTTGRKGEFSTRFGTIEFVHTDATATEILANTIRQDGHPLPLATKQYALKNLQNTRRSKNLIDWEEVSDD